MGIIDLRGGGWEVNMEKFELEPREAYKAFRDAIIKDIRENSNTGEVYNLLLMIVHEGIHEIGSDLKSRKQWLHLLSEQTWELLKNTHDNYGDEVPRLFDWEK